MSCEDAPWLKSPLRDSLLSGPLVDISVGSGEAKRNWSLHRNLLVYHSPFFASRFGEHAQNDSKGKGHALTLDLQDDTPAAFELLVKWLYQGSIDDVSSLNNDKKWEYAFACQQLYALCERIGLTALKNVAIDQFRLGCHQAGLVPGPEEMVPVYENTPEGSPFRKLVARIAARQIMDPDQKRDATTYKQCIEKNPHFAIDVINAIRQGIGGQLLPDPTEDSGCEYHAHDDGHVCSKKLKNGNGQPNGIGILKYTALAFVLIVWLMYTQKKSHMAEIREL